jgi:hypothetical protein
MKIRPSQRRNLPPREGEGMAKEYKVTVDQSLKAENDPKALERSMRELAREGWELKHVTSVTAGTGQDIVNTSRIYLFWERDAVTN